jgi:hypothetical protein
MAEEAKGDAPQVADLVLRSLKRTYDMFSTESSAAMPAFLPRWVVW